MPFNTQAMRIIVDNFNEVLEQERERHGIPIEHFEPLGADVHPVQLVASRMFSSAPLQYIGLSPHSEKEIQRFINYILDIVFKC